VTWTTPQMVSQWEYLSNGLTTGQTLRFLLKEILFSLKGITFHSTDTKILDKNSFLDVNVEKWSVEDAMTLICRQKRAEGRKRVGDVWTLAEDHVFGPVFLINNVLALLTAASQLFKMAYTHTHTHTQHVIAAVTAWPWTANIHQRREGGK